MSSAPWITIIGLGEDGLNGLSPASLSALDAAEIVMGAKRHLGLLDLSANTIEWPVPFADGLEVLKGLEGQKVVVLASGDPFWFGAGTVIARHFKATEWTCLPTPSVFSLAASHLGWALEKTICLGLHAAPMSRLRPCLANGAKILVTLRDGAAVSELAQFLTDTGADASELIVLQALGGPNERITKVSVAEALKGGFGHPVLVAIQTVVQGATLPQCSGLPNDVFETDGVMTKRPVRALTLSALAPCAGETLWDIGGGSGTIAIEWLLAHPACQAITIEPREDRLALIKTNAMRLGVDRLQIVHGAAPDALANLPKPDAVFIGGGISEAMINRLSAIAQGARVVANGVTLEAEVLLTQLHAKKGGDLMRFDIARAKPLGSKRGWDTAYPVIQWNGHL